MAKRNYLSQRTRSKEREPKPKESAGDTALSRDVAQSLGPVSMRELAVPQRKEPEIKVNGKLLIMKQSRRSQTQRNGLQQSVIRRAFKSISQSG